jgi:hypothetical protein
MPTTREARGEALWEIILENPQLTRGLSCFILNHDSATRVCPAGEGGL